MQEEDRLNLTYRGAYHFAYLRIHAAGVYADPEAVPIDPAEAVRHMGPKALDDPEVRAVVEEGIADARAGRRPRW